MKNRIFFYCAAIATFFLTKSMAPSGGVQGDGSGGFGGLLIILVVIGAIGYFAFKYGKRKSSGTTLSTTSVPTGEKKSDNNMLGPVIVLAFAAVLYFGSMILERQSEDLRHRTYRGSGSKESFKTARVMRETSEYAVKGSIAVAIAGGLWLIVIAIQSTKK